MRSPGEPDDRPTVLMVAAMAFPAPQGSQVYVGGMARALAAAGWRVRLACYGHGVGAWPVGVERVAVRRAPGGRVASGPHLGKVPQDLALADAVRRALADGVDVVHAHHVEAPLLAAVAGALAALGGGRGRRGRAPLVINPHTSLREELPVYLPAWAARPAAWAGEALDRAVARHGDAAVAISPRSEVLLRGWGAARVAYVPPGVDVDALQGGDAARARAAWGLEGRRWVAYTGNTDAYQDLDVLVGAIATMPDVGLIVASGGPFEGVRAEAAARGLAPARLRCVADAGLPAALDALAAADVAAVPRRTCAGFPMKLLNQLGAGRVTVANTAASLPLPGVIQVGDGVAAFADGLRRALDAPDRERLGRAGREAVRDGFGWDAVAARLGALYATLGVRLP